MNFDAIEHIYKKISKNTRVCFATGMILGLLTHIYMLTNKLTNWDDINSLQGYGAGDNIGRWMLKYIHGYGGVHSVPAIHGVLMIVCLSIAACVVLEILHLKSMTSAVLVPAFMVTFPSVACTMTFMFTAHTYALAILAMVVAVWLLRTYRWGFAPACVLLIMGMAVYQSYISIVIALMLLALIVEILENGKNKQIIWNGILCVVVLIISVVAYMVLCRMFYPDIQNETYGGVGNMGKLAIAEIPRMIGRCYKRFGEYFIWKPFAFMNQGMQIVNVITLLLAIGLGCYLIIIKKMWRDWLKLVIYLILAGLLPLATAFVYFMAPEAEHSMLMIYAYVCIYIGMIMLWEQSSARFRVISKKPRKLMANSVTMVVLIISLLSVYMNYLVTNTAYMRTQIADERVKAYYNRLIVMVEQTEGYQNGDPVEILGEFNYRSQPSPIEVDVMDTELFREMSGVALENGLLTMGVRDNYLKVFLGFQTADLSWDEKETIMQSEEYKQMPCYPESGCVQKFDEVWIVKLCDVQSQ